MKLTRKLIDSLEPRATEFFVWCAVMPGFGVRVQPTGRKVYLVRYRTEAGTQRKYTIGRCDALHPDDARDRAREVIAEAARGGDPARDRRDKREGATIADLAERHTKAKAGHVKAGTARNHEILWRLHILPRLGDKRVADLTPEDIADLHLDMGETPVNANRALELVAAALKIAERIGWRPRGSNPAADVPAYPENERQRILTPDEIKALFAACDSYAGSQRAAPWLVRLLILSGKRVSEWSCSKWSWVDFQRATLTLPDSKVGAITYHLPDAVIETLRQWRALTNSAWIIPGVDETVPLRFPHRYWSEIRDAAGLEGVRLHDLRHTIGSLGHMAGLSQRDIAELLGHRQLKTTERYLNTYDERKREAANKAAQAIDYYRK